MIERLILINIGIGSGTKKINISRALQQSTMIKSLANQNFSSWPFCHIWIKYLLWLCISEKALLLKCRYGCQLFLSQKHAMFTSSSPALNPSRKQCIFLLFSGVETEEAGRDSFRRAAQRNRTYIWYVIPSRRNAVPLFIKTRSRPASSISTPEYNLTWNISLFK